jgi:hypothetical protein
VRDLGFERREAALGVPGREGSAGEERGEVVVGFGEVECAVASMGGIVEASFVVYLDHRCNRDKDY